MSLIRTIAAGSVYDATPAETTIVADVCVTSFSTQIRL
jgi:hypothetical protein